MSGGMGSGDMGTTSGQTFDDLSSSQFLPYNSLCPNAAPAQKSATLTELIAHRTDYKSYL